MRELAGGTPEGELLMWGIQTLKFGAILSTMAPDANAGIVMKTMSARDAKNGFGLLMDTARLEPVLIRKHGRPVVVVLSVEEFERISSGATADVSEVGDADRKSKDSE